jgi:anti-sigma factor RsiW
MNCWRIQNLVAPFLDGALNSDEEQRIGEHLEACSECNTLVEGVAALPDMPFTEFGAELEASLFEDFEASLSDRIRESVLAGVDAYGLQPEASEEVAPRPGLAALLGSQRGLRLSPGLVGAYLAVLGLLAGGIAWNYSQALELEASLEQRDEIIDALQQRLVTLDLEREIGFGFASDTLSPTGPVFMPAQAPRALPTLPTAGFQARGRAGTQSSPYQRVSLDGLRVIR